VKIQIADSGSPISDPFAPCNMTAHCYLVSTRISLKRVVPMLRASVGQRNPKIARDEFFVFKAKEHREAGLH